MKNILKTIKICFSRFKIKTHLMFNKILLFYVIRILYNILFSMKIVGLARRLGRLAIPFYFVYLLLYFLYSNKNIII